MPAACVRLEDALGALERRADDEALVARLVAADDGRDVHDGSDAGHRLGPALVVEDIGLDEIEAGMRRRRRRAPDTVSRTCLALASERMVPRTR